MSVDPNQTPHSAAQHLIWVCTVCSVLSVQVPRVRHYFCLTQCSAFQSRSRAQNILPVTVAEILNATQNEDKFYTGDIEMLQVCRVSRAQCLRMGVPRTPLCGVNESFNP